MIAGVDLTSPESFKDGPPLAFFEILRHQAPVWWHDKTERRGGFWVISRYEDVQQVLSQPSTFVNAKGITIETSEPAGVDAAAPERGQGALSYTDPPEHRVLRQVLARYFTPGRIRQLDQQLVARAEALVDAFATSGGGDFIARVAEPYPLAVLSSLLELPQETAVALGRFVRTIGARPPGVVDDPVSDAARSQFLTAIDELAAVRARTPGDDLISGMMSATGDAGTMVAERLSGILIQLAIAGNETTRAAAGHGAWLLAEHPAAQDALRTNPDLGTVFVEEVLRYRPPVHYTRRTAAQAAPMGQGKTAVTAAPGDVVYLSLASANRDETIYESPATFNTKRFERRGTHLGLGFAEHYCLGAAIARTELRCLFTAIVTQTTELVLSGPVMREPFNTFIDGLAHLPLSVSGVHPYQRSEE